MRFSDLSLIQPLVRAVAEDGYSEPTPIQAQAIPHVLAGRDLLAIAQTGTGKTAAFALPLLQRLASVPGAAHRRPIRVLVLTPTRELAAQVGEAFSEYGRHLPLRNAVVFGGVPQRPQARAIADGIDVLVATPGRLLDLLGQRLVSFDRLEALVLDEADRMLDMGFLPAVRRILAVLPRRRQTLFFSATMGRDPQALADSILEKPARVEVTPQATTVEKVTQAVYFVDKSDKQALLEHLLAGPAIARALVFTRTKHGANRVAQKLSRAGVDAEAIHANKSQRQRERALAGFRSGDHRVLVATDIAARGIDVDDITHVVNFDLPNIPESYVHRIGRTARAGADGAAISFCDASERAFLRDIEREIRAKVPVVDDHPYRRGGPRPPDAMPVDASPQGRFAQGLRPAGSPAAGSPTEGPGVETPAAWVEPQGRAPHAHASLQPARRFARRRHSRRSKHAQQHPFRAQHPSQGSDPRPASAAPAPHAHPPKHAAHSRPPVHGGRVAPSRRRRR